MAVDIPETYLQLKSIVTPDGELVVTLERLPVPAPGSEEVLVQVQAAPINPSDLGLLFGSADLGRAVYSGSAEQPVLTAPLPAAAQAAM